MSNINKSVKQKVPFSKGPSLGLSGKVWLSIAIFALLAVSFGVYVYWEKQIDRANDLRHVSFLLADELRQSSDDLTRMARTYVVTGDPRYKEYYQDILDIRNGKKPRPKAYQHAYWDLMLDNPLLPQPDSGQAIALLELMHQTGFTEEEFARLTEAKVNSDRLTALEFEAMKLAESVGADKEAVRVKALLMLHDERYHKAKSAIMRPINEFYVSMDRRTRDTVRNAKNVALFFRLLFVATTLAAVFTLWRTYAILRSTLGGSAGEVHAQIVRIGRGDFSTAVAVAPGMENSVLAGLLEMQNKLQDYETERRESEAFKQAILNSVAAEICVLDRDGVIMAVNEPWRRFVQENSIESAGSASGTDVGANYLAVCNENGAIDARDGILAVLDGRLPSYSLEYPCHSPHRQRWFTMIVTPLGEVTGGGVVVTHTDITERKQMEEQIRNLAYFDPLTNLPNRRMLLDRLAHALAEAKRYHRSLAIMFLDLDNFKKINDTLGHDIGDELLKEVSVRLSTCIRAGDTVSRQGGDEFIIVLTEITNPDDASLVADKIIKAINMPVQITGNLLNVSTSIGIAVYPINGRDDAQELMKKADKAMYAAKAAGRNGYKFFVD
ncbi:MAG: sensor domain-containing diguanylate cyclase [Sulfuricella sp.]